MQRLLRLSEIASSKDKPGIVGLCRSTIWLRVKHGRFPHPVRLGTRSVAWRSQDIEAWLADPQGWQSSK